MVTSRVAQGGFKFRRMVVLDCFSNSFNNLQKLYSDESNGVGRPPRPFWLNARPSFSGANSSTHALTNHPVIGEREMRPGFERQKGVFYAAADMTSRRIDIGCRRIEPKLNDYGEFIGFESISILTKLLNTQRRSGIHTFDETLGYIFVEWGGNGSSLVLQKNRCK